MKELIQGINWKFVLVAVLVAALISWLFIFDGIGRLKGMFAININNDNSSSNNSTNSNTNVSSSSSSASATAYGQQGYPLHLGTGSKSKPSSEVRSMQEAANYYLRNDIAADGVWGPDTEAAMKTLRTARRTGSRTDFSPDMQFSLYITPDTNGRMMISEEQAKKILQCLLYDRQFRLNQNIA